MELKELPKCPVENDTKAYRGKMENFNNKGFIKRYETFRGIKESLQRNFTKSFNDKSPLYGR